MNLTIPADLAARIAEIAQQLGRAPEETALLAVQEFVDHWGGYIQDLDSIDTAAEKRAILKTLAD